MKYLCFTLESVEHNNVQYCNFMFFFYPAKMDDIKLK